MVHECPAEGCDFESESIKGVNTHINLSEKHEGDILKYPTDEMLLDELKRLSKKLGKTPSAKDMKENGKHSYSIYEKRFGTWNNAIKKSELKINVEGDVSDDDLHYELLRLSEKLNKSPTQEEMAKYGKYSVNAYRGTFRSWNDALRDVGLSTNAKQNIYKEELKEELLRLSEVLGETPTVKDMREKGKYGIGVYQSKFGTWTNAKREVGLDPLEHSDWVPSGENSPHWNGGANHFSSSISGKAWTKAVYQRDEYTCQDCGKAHTEVHAHHIKRRSNNPDLKTTVWNGVTLCQACHAERHKGEHVYEVLKSNVDESEWDERQERLDELGKPYFLTTWDDVPFIREKDNEPLVNTDE